MTEWQTGQKQYALDPESLDTSTMKSIEAQI